MQKFSPQHIEEAGLNAWPGLDTFLYDGWIIRRANGYTKRANSVTPLYPSKLALETKIDYCQQLYKQWQLRPTFRLPAFSTPPELEQLLATRGYRQIDITSVQVRELDSYETANNAQENYCTFLELDSWLKLFHTLDPYRKDLETHGQLLHKAVGISCPMALKVAGEWVACGLGVVNGRYLGLFDIVTATTHRQQGYATQLINSLLTWGVKQGANQAYLQVMVDNTPANHLYAKLRFTELYRYWYRVLD